MLPLKLVGYFFVGYKEKILSYNEPACVIHGRVNENILIWEGKHWSNPSKHAAFF